MDRRRFLTIAGAALAAGACADDSALPDTLDGSVDLPLRPAPSNALVTRWGLDPFARGSYSYLAVGATPSDREALRSDVGSELFFAGEATSTDHPSTVHGALLEGRAAALRIDAATDGPSSVVVVGGGAAGLAAARSLTDLGHTVVLVEARDRLGGRVHTTTLRGTPVDLGASWVHGVDGNPLTELAEQRGVPLSPFDGESIIARNSSGAVESGDALDAAYERLERLVDDVEPGRSIGSVIEEALDTLTPAEQRLLRYVVASEIEHEAAIDASRLDTGFLLEGTGFGGLDALVPSGYWQMLSQLTSGVDIRTGTVVERIAVDAAEGTTTPVMVEMVRGDALAADHVLVTVPLGVLKAETITFDPPLPDDKVSAIGRLGSGVLDKVVLRFDEPFWDGTAFVGHIGTEPGRFLEWLNLEPVTGEPIIVGFNVGSIAEQLASRSDQIVVAEAVDILHSMY